MGKDLQTDVSISVSSLLTLFSFKTSSCNYYNIYNCKNKIFYFNYVYIMYVKMLLKKGVSLFNFFLFLF